MIDATQKQQTVEAGNAVGSAGPAVHCLSLSRDVNREQSTPQQNELSSSTVFATCAMCSPHPSLLLDLKGMTPTVVTALLVLKPIRCDAFAAQDSAIAIGCKDNSHLQRTAFLQYAAKITATQ